MFLFWPKVKLAKSGTLLAGERGRKADLDWKL